MSLIFILSISNLLNKTYIVHIYCLGLDQKAVEIIIYIVFEIKYLQIMFP